jgi:Uma2 family endonuclease
MVMSVQTLIPVEQYLHTSYQPDREYRDGVVKERNVGDKSHALLQARLATYLGRRRKQWQIEVYTEFRIRARENWYPIPDVCAYLLPAPEERFPSTMPLLWIEILSADDRMVEVWEKARDLVQCGAPYVWIINPITLESELRTSAGVSQIQDKTLRLPDSPILVPLLEVMEED